MKVLGVIVEYNPFHNGHLYHIKKSKEISGADYVVSVMSGNFIQRGEPAIVNKWIRAKMALLSGVDLIIELPLPYAVSSAEFFAFGAIKILNDIGIVDYICFGSENSDINNLDAIAKILINEPESYKALLKKALSEGLSYPLSREIALSEYIESENFRIDELSELLTSSNNILGIEYLKALRKLKSNITPLTIKRTNNTYNSSALTGNISSATSIRRHVMETSDSAEENLLKEVMPEVCLCILNKEFSSGRGPVFAENFEDIILALLRKMDTSDIRKYPYISEGLENRIKKASLTSGSYYELVDNICTKRYTKTRIQRILMSILIGITSYDFDMFNQYGGPTYARVLGFNEKGKYLLSKTKKKTSIPVILKTADFMQSCNPLVRKMLELESYSTDIYVLAFNNPSYRRAGQDFTQNVVRITDNQQ